MAARTDPLTNLANRREFDERFGNELERARRGGRPLAIVVLDLDGFKAYNDALGHQAGDDALREFADLLRRTTRAIDTVARTGGEEFAILAPEARAGDAHAYAERVRSSVERSFTEPRERLTVSCGIAVFPACGANSRDLLLAADRAMYLAKADGRNRTVVHDAAGRVPETPSPPRPRPCCRAAGGGSSAASVRAPRIDLRSMTELAWSRHPITSSART